MKNKNKPWIYVLIIRERMGIWKTQDPERLKHIGKYRPISKQQYDYWNINQSKWLIKIIKLFENENYEFNSFNPTIENTITQQWKENLDRFKSFLINFIVEPSGDDVKIHKDRLGDLVYNTNTSRDAYWKDSKIYFMSRTFESLEEVRLTFLRIFHKIRQVELPDEIIQFKKLLKMEETLLENVKPLNKK